MVDSNSNRNENDPNKGKDKDKHADTAAKLSDDLLRLVEEDDGKVSVSYSVESVSDDELIYSSVSKAQAFSFVEGYRAANGKGEDRPRKPRENGTRSEASASDSDKSGTPPAIDPSKTKRKRVVF
jgi:hypothetical protein